MNHGARFSVLGPVRAWGDGRELDLGPPQCRAVLSSLLMRAGRRVSLQQIIDDVWSSHRPDSASGSVRNHVHRIRRVLATAEGPHLYSADGGYMLDGIAAASLDALRFRSLVDEGHGHREAGRVELAMAALSQALGLWQGAPFKDVPGPYAGKQGRLLEEVRLNAVVERLGLLVAVGDYSGALPDLTRLLSLHPMHEYLAELLIRALHATGQTDEAVRIYSRVRAQLRDRLGVDPSPPLREAAQEAKLMRPGPLPARVPSRPRRARTDLTSLPALPCHFVGREAELAEGAAFSAASSTGPSLLLLTGTGGVGKTVLASRLARDVADEYPDGQLFIDLEGAEDSKDPLAPREALARLLVALGVAADSVPPDTSACAALYRSMLAGRRMLVVLDNARDSAHVSDLIAGSDGFTIVTSRDGLSALVIRYQAHVVTLGPRVH